MRLNTKRVITEAINTTLSGGAIEALSGYIEHVKAITRHGTLNSSRQNVINAFRDKFRDSDDVYNIWKGCTPDSFDDIACERCEERYGDDYTEEQFEEELKRVMYADFLSGLNNFQCDKRGYIYVVRDMLIPRNATKDAFSEYGDGFGVCWSGFETSKPDVPYNKEKQVRIRVYALAPSESVEYEYSVFSFVGAGEGEIGLKKGSQIEIGRIEAIVESIGCEYLDKDGDKDKRQAMLFNSLEDENRHTNKFTLPLNYPLIGKA